MSTEIYYFSGTGNSLHVARELQHRIPGSTLTPIVRLLGRDAIKTSADTVGLVFPNFCLTIPIPLYDFLGKVDLASARYVFAVCTRGGTPSEAFDFINAILGKQGKRLSAQLNVTMPWNHPLGPDDLIGTNTEERVLRLESEMLEKLGPFAESILESKEHLVEDTDASYEIPRWIWAINSLIPKSLNYASHRHMYQNLIQFFCDSNCVGCGVCEQVCLSHKIQMVGKKPVWREEPKCYGCFACINYCPQQAIQIASRAPFYKSYTGVYGRYHHESITHMDIAQQR